jgi:hypothetical protein
MTILCAGLEVLTVVAMKSWLNVNQRFGKHIHSIFRVEKEAEQETSVKAGDKPSHVLLLIKYSETHSLCKWFADVQVRSRCNSDNKKNIFTP